MLTPRRWAAIAGLLLATAVALSGCAKVPGVYVYEDKGAQPAGAAPADAKSYVADAWAARIVPTVHDQATEIGTVAAALAQDPAAAGQQYGHQAGTGSPYAFMVKGTGTVTKVDTSVQTGPMTVEVAQSGGKPLTISIATGPVIAGTALRDAVGFISFGDFTNQIEYADVANEINARVKTEVIAKVDLAAAVGKEITFHGAFSALPNAPTILVVPTELSVAS
ncbi:DUF2291 domain-containing protein [Asanoa sp. NPDC050611]|uniref:DUF2291 family protein n=1 Tax=Asanoa sp. NPDC050611 TaxID=3157098 RepID=UPI003406FFDA